ncbi:MAG: HD domain-containing protein [Bryobacterales bacterium]|nr:HD domain-containing protein [Bryobacterales bacterium]
MHSSRFEDAVSFAAHLHRAQFRKGTQIPYLSHLFAVSSLVMEHGGGEDEIIAALLHDAIEDQGDPYPGGRPALRAEIEARFGRQVLEIVNGCTDDDGFVKADGPEGWRQRKQHYLEHLQHASDAVRLVSCADKLHNARSILADFRRNGNAVWQRFRSSDPEDHVWVLTELASRFEGNPRDLASELAWTVEQIIALHRKNGEGSGIPDHP